MDFDLSRDSLLSRIVVAIDHEAKKDRRQGGRDWQRPAAPPAAESEEDDVVEDSLAVTEFQDSEALPAAAARQTLGTGMSTRLLSLDLEAAWSGIAALRTPSVSGSQLARASRAVHFPVEVSA